MVPLASAAAEEAVLAAAAARGVAVDGLARHHAGPRGAAGIVLGYAGPPSADLARALATVTAVLRAPG